MNALRSMFSDSSGNIDDARVAAFLVVLSFIVNSFIAVLHGQPWDAQSYGVGAGALSAGVGVWFGQRKEN